MSTEEVRKRKEFVAGDYVELEKDVQLDAKYAPTAAEAITYSLKKGSRGTVKEVLDDMVSVAFDSLVVSVHEDSLININVKASTSEETWELGKGMVAISLGAVTVGRDYPAIILSDMRSMGQVGELVSTKEAVININESKRNVRLVFLNKESIDVFIDQLEEARLMFQ